MTGRELRQKYLDFFVERGHQVIPPAPLVLENDPTTLFTSSGMQPLVPYLLGQMHPAGQRLVNLQPCFRGQGFFDDTLEVGNNRHTTFFEMEGNWSLGNYFKEEQLSWFWQFLTQELKLPPGKLFVSVFEGTKEIPPDLESVAIWKKLGVPEKRIFYYGVNKNWWSRSGTPEQMPTDEIGGPDSEVFYQYEIAHDRHYGQQCHPNCDCGRFLEIGNSVFIQYQKQKDGSFKELAQKNVDFGGGYERQLATVNNYPKQPDIFLTDLFGEIILTIEKAADKKYLESVNQAAIRVIADHLKGATFMMQTGVIPSNKEQGYILRRLLRRSAVKMQQLSGQKISPADFTEICECIMKTYEGIYFEIDKDLPIIKPVIEEEIKRFSQTLDRGLKVVAKIDQFNGQVAFDLYQSYGFPLEITNEMAALKNQTIDRQEFLAEFKKHQQLSRRSIEKKFKGGLLDHSEIVIKYHTTTHLLHAALRKVLGEQVYQAGSNLTAERLRFDFTHDGKLTETEIKQIEKLINQKIKENLPVKMEMMSLEEAKKQGALAFFEPKYDQQIKVYKINDFSVEVCGGPHVSSTGQIGKIEIYKEEGLGVGKRRIYLRFMIN